MPLWRQRALFLSASTSNQHLTKNNRLTITVTAINHAGSEEPVEYIEDFRKREPQKKKNRENTRG